MNNSSMTARERIVWVLALVLAQPGAKPRILFPLILLIVTLPRLQAIDQVWPKDEKAVIAQAKATIPCVIEFRELFPHATVYMGYPASVRYTAETEREVMETVYLYASVGLYRRYTLTMVVPLKLKADRLTIASFKDPGFGIQQVGEIIVSPNGQASITYAPSAGDFDYARFKRLKAQHGDFSAIGIHLIKDKPIKNFEREWKPDQ